MQTFSLGYSTCPNDTFIFDALVHKKINTQGFDFKLTLADVEVLNKKAQEQALDITKLSTFAYAGVADNYQILDSGAALGYNNGPLLIAKKNMTIDEINNARIAIPGINTTAHFLFSILFPGAQNKTEILFSDIEKAIGNDIVDCGLIIHETRFTYAQHGFTKLADMGELWEQKTGMPIPLGCIAIKRSLPYETKHTIETLIRESVEYAFSHPEEALLYCKQHAQEMSSQVMQQHIQLYVNNFSQSLSDKGKNAIEFFYEKALQTGKLIKKPQNIFLT